MTWLLAQIIRVELVMNALNPDARKDLAMNAPNQDARKVVMKHKILLIEFLPLPCNCAFFLLIYHLLYYLRLVVLLCFSQRKALCVLH